MRLRHFLPPLLGVIPNEIAGLPAMKRDLVEMLHEIHLKRFTSDRYLLVVDYSTTCVRHDRKINLIRLRQIALSRLSGKSTSFLGPMRVYHVYILASLSKVLYTGVTNNLERRVCEHEEKRGGKFTVRYHVNRLVYFEPYDDVTAAIAREKQIKAWRRAKRVALINSMNPTWRDLSAYWYT